MKVLRTPEERFDGLPDFGYPPRYADVGGLRLAYVETGPADGEPVLLLHGEPSCGSARSRSTTSACAA